MNNSKRHWQVGNTTLFMWNTVNILIYYYSVLICILFLCTNLYSTEVNNCPNVCIGAKFFHWRCASSLNHCDLNSWFIAKVANFVLDLVSRVCNLQTTLFQTFHTRPKNQIQCALNAHLSCYLPTNTSVLCQWTGGLVDANGPRVVLASFWPC